MEHHRPPRYNQFSPPHSVADHEASEKTFPNPSDLTGAPRMGDSQDIRERLARLVHLASQDIEIRESDLKALHHCLDTVESLLDPRFSLTKEIVRHRPQNVHSGPPIRPTASLSSIQSISANQKLASTKASVSHLAGLHDDIVAISVELDQRRMESFHIYQLFAQERQELARKNSELGDEINELQIDMLEDSAEREALEGTVCGLETWIDGWQVQHDLNLMRKSKGASPRGGKGWWSKRKPEMVDDSDIGALLDGISAWMRGWKDAEEGFRSREAARKLKRDGRQRRTQTADNGRESFTT